MTYRKTLCIFFQEDVLTKKELAPVESTGMKYSFIVNTGFNTPKAWVKVF